MSSAIQEQIEARLKTAEPQVEVLRADLVGGSTVAGIVSDRDVLHAIADRGAAALGEAVRGIMTERVVTCSARDPVGAVMATMTNRRIRHVPVVDGDGRLGGIVSIGDVVKHRLDEIGREAEAMREYIGGTW